MHHLKKSAGLLFLLFLYVQLHSQAVFDKGDMFTFGEEMKIRYELVRLLRQTSIPVVVHTEASLGGVTVDGKATQLFADYAIGEKWANNGILVLIALQEQQYCIRTGYGMEWIITDAIADELGKLMPPFFAKTFYYEGVHALLHGMREKIPVLDWGLTPTSLDAIGPEQEGHIVAFIYRGGNRLKNYAPCDPKGPQFKESYRLSLAEGPAKFTLCYTSHMGNLLELITGRNDAQIYARVVSYKQRRLELTGAD